MALPISKKTGTEIKRRPSRNKYDWPTLRKQYIEGIPTQDSKNERWYPNLRELAELHEMPYERLRKRSAEERWTHKKEAAELIVIAERSKKRAKEIAKNAMDFDEKSHNVAKIGMAMVTTRLAEIAKETEVKRPFRDDAMDRLRKGEHVEPHELYTVVRYKELEGLANAAERFNQLGMRALGTDVQRIDVTGMGDVTVNNNVVNVSAEMRRDDSDRMAAMFEAMGESGLLPTELIEALGGEDDTADNIIEGEVVPITPEDTAPIPNDLVEADSNGQE